MFVKLTCDDPELLPDFGGHVDPVEVVIAEEASRVHADVRVDLRHVFCSGWRIQVGSFSETTGRSGGRK